MTDLCPFFGTVVIYAVWDRGSYLVGYVERQQTRFIALHSNHSHLWKPGTGYSMLWGDILPSRRAVIVPEEWT